MQYPTRKLCIPSPFSLSTSPIKLSRPEVKIGKWRLLPFHKRHLGGTHANANDDLGTPSQITILAGLLEIPEIFTDI
jgi:hypothetical protein